MSDETNSLKSFKIKAETVKNWLDVGQKISVLGGFLIFANLCYSIHRMPDIEFSSLVVLLGVSIAFAALLLLSVVGSGLLPALFISHVISLHRVRKVQGFRPGLAALVLTFGQLLILGAGFTAKHGVWIIPAALAITYLIIPLCLTLVTRDSWRQKISESQIVISKRPEKAANTLTIACGFIVWAVLSSVFSIALFEILLGSKFEYEIEGPLIAMGTIVIANVFVEASTYRNSGE